MCFGETQKQISTYEERADAVLESQSTIETFMNESEMEAVDMAFNLKDNNGDEVGEALDKINFFPADLQNTSNSILQLQDTIEEFEIKRQESTYEERAERHLEAQTTVDSFTNEIKRQESDFDDKTDSLLKMQDTIKV